MTENEQKRLVRHRLAILRHVEEVTGNVSQTCRYYGISWPTFYKWLHRYEEKGLEGLETARVGRTTARTRRALRWWARSSTCVRTTTSDPPRSRRI